MPLDEPSDLLLSLQPTREGSEPAGCRFRLTLGRHPLAPEAALQIGLELTGLWEDAAFFYYAENPSAGLS